MEGQAIAFLLLFIGTSCVFSASLKSSFEQLDDTGSDESFNNDERGTSGNGAINKFEYRVNDETPSLDFYLADQTNRDILQNPSTNLCSDCFSSTAQVHIVKRAITSTKTILESTASPVVQVTSTSEIVKSTPVFNSSSNFILDEIKELTAKLGNSTKSIPVQLGTPTIANRLTNVVRRFVQFTVGLLLTPFTVVAQHLSKQ